MKLKYKGRNRTLIKTSVIANKILNDTSFYNEISAIPKFDNTSPTDLKPSDIANLLKTFPKKVYIKTYIAPFGANAKTKRSKYFKINLSRLGRKEFEIVRTMIHEFVHCVDFSLKEYKFTHNDNHNEHGDEDNTAPWAIGAISEKYAKVYLNM